MLDVILYGYDGRGFLILQERKFRTHRELARFFGSSDAISWEWAEVHDDRDDVPARVVRYSTADLLSPIEFAGMTFLEN